MIDLAGGELETRFVDGDDARPGLVFLHEGLGSVDLWRAFPDAIRTACDDPAMLVYSRHGHGRSAPAMLPRPVSYMHHEADVVLPALLRAFGVERPILIGHSDGASIALLYAGAGQPVAGLVLLAPHVFVEDVTVASIDAMRVEYERTDLGRRMSRYHDDADATFRGWNDAWLDPAFRAWNIEHRLAAIDCPVLLIQGEDDAYGTLAQLDAIESQVGGATRRLVLRGVGHAPHLEAQAAVVEAVANFVREVSAQSSL